MVKCDSSLLKWGKSTKGLKTEKNVIFQSGILPRKLGLKSLLSLNDLMGSLKTPSGSFVHFRIHKNSVVNVLFKINKTTK